MKREHINVQLALSGADENVLLQKLPDGDVDAFSLLYKKYQPKLRVFLYPFKAVEDPEEVIQDIFLKIWVKRETLAGLQSFEQYLFRMAKNRVLDLLKSNEARRRRELQWQQHSDDAIADGFNIQEYKEFHRFALEAIRNLPPRQQQIYTLRVFEDLSLDEIGEVMNVSKAVVTKQLYLATKAVRKEVAKFPLDTSFIKTTLLPLVFMFGDTIS
ncbi:MAG: sigma-70 family RNA polymerase sigma factor [Chitinophagaceae bacterium]